MVSLLNFVIALAINRAGIDLFPILDILEFRMHYVEPFSDSEIRLSIFGGSHFGSIAFQQRLFK